MNEDFKILLEFGLTLLTGFLWWETRKLAKDAERSGSDNLKESKRLADAAESSAKASDRSAAAAERASDTSREIHESDKLLSQRQLLVPLWTYITSMDEIDPKNLNEPNVVKTINALELIALCCEAGMVDEAVIKATFTDVYIRQYEVISGLSELKSLKKDGKAILRENRVAARFYEKLKKEDVDRGKITNKP